MAPVPKKKHTHRRSAVRRGSKKLSLPHLIKCGNCGKLKMVRLVCKHCSK